LVWFDDLQALQQAAGCVALRELKRGRWTKRLESVEPRREVVRQIQSASDCVARQNFHRRNVT